MKVLDLCSGYGGFALALGHTPVGFAEIDPDASKVLDHHWPTVPNFGDLNDVPPDLDVDVVTAGFPCQPVSTAGARRGTHDERWLFDDIADLLGRMGTRPRWVYLENVRGLLSADGGDALARVVHRLADLGYVGRYGILAAADVGACHRRERWFCIAHTDSTRRQGWGAVPERRGERPVGQGGMATPLPTPTATYPGGTAERYRERLTEHDGRGGKFLSLNHAIQALPTPQATNSRSMTAGRPNGLKETTSLRWNLYDVAYADRFGEYQAAVDHHAGIYGPPPAPTDDKGRLSPRFVEWMMCLPAGWVTGCGSSRTAQLRILGNGIVPPQAAAAIELLGGEP